MTEEAKKEKKSKLKKVDERIRKLIVNGVARRHRSLFLVVGDHGRDQVVFLHHVLTQALVEEKREHRVLWCYKQQLGFTSHFNKKMKKLDKQIRTGRVDVDTDDPFKLFIAATRITYCRYQDSHRILGNTFTMLILQDFEAMTPNLLARTVETVKGGGLVVILVQVQGLQSLESIKMDVHSRYVTEAHTDVVARFNLRFMKSLHSCATCIAIDDRLNVLSAPSYLENAETMVPQSKSEDATDMENIEGVTELTQPLIKKCATSDQRQAVMKLVDVIAEKTFRTTVALTAGRGRGKSAALGLAIAAAVAHQYGNIFVTAPSPENLKTLFEFVFIGFDALGYQEHRDYTILKSTNPEFKNTVVRVNVTITHRQTIQYIHPTDSAKLGQAELLCVDEAAAIPLPLVRSMLGPYLVFLSSTVSGYEGTGRSLSLKLIAQLRNQAGQSASAGEDVALTGRKLEEVTLTESIRYAAKDPVERWLHRLLCLEAALPHIPKPRMTDSCELYYVNRDRLFDCSKHSEEFLQAVLALFVSSHYKNSPNDLQMLSDAPAHHIFVLMGPDVPGAKKKPDDIYCAIQVCLEGEISNESVKQGLKRGIRASGDLIPWTVSSQFSARSFATLSGARIVRIATHPDCTKMGYGSRALALLEQYFEGKMPSLDQNTDHHQDAGSEQDSKQGELFARLTDRPPEKLDYLGVSYGLTYDLLRFWKKGGFKAVYLRQTANDLTGEHSCIMLKPLNSSSVENTWMLPYWTEFRGRFMKLLSYSFRSFNPAMALTLLDQKAFLKTKPASEGGGERQTGLSAFQIKRLREYRDSLVDYHQILDLVPALADLFFTGAVTLSMSQIQQGVLLAMGLQHRSVEDCARDLGMESRTTLGLFHKVVTIMHDVLNKQQEREVAESMPVEEVELKTTPVGLTLNEDLEHGASMVRKLEQKYGIVASDKDILKEMADKTKIPSIVSVKSSLAKRKRAEALEADAPRSGEKKKKKQHHKHKKFQGT